MSDQRLNLLSICGLVALVLCWIDCQLIVGLSTAATFGTARNTFGVILLVAVVITFLCLFIYSTVQEMLFERLLRTAREIVDRGTHTAARDAYIKAQIFNDRWLQRKDLRLVVLQGLLEIYQKTGDLINANDVEHRIRVNHRSDAVTTMEQRLIQERLAPAPKESKSTHVYLIATIFAGCILIGSVYQCPAPPEVPFWQDLSLRLVGWIGSAFILAEAMHGRAHGGAGPTAYFDERPNCFAIRSGLLLFLCIFIMLRLDRTVITSGFWQLPITMHGWFITVGGPSICGLLTYALAAFRLTTNGLHRP